MNGSAIDPGEYAARSVTYDGFVLRRLDRATFLRWFAAPQLFISVNPLMVEKCRASLADIVAENVGYMDGIGLCLAVWRNGGGWSPRIAGSDMWREAIRTYPDRRYAVIGARPEVHEEAMRRLRHEFPQTIFAYARHGLFDATEESEAIARALAEARVDCVFLALGTPLQELVAARLHALHSATYMGIGGSLDVYTGAVRGAPRAVKAVGLEWAWRWAAEPVKRTGMNLALARFALGLARRRDIALPIAR